MTLDHTAGSRLRGWSYGLATWILATYTAERDVVLDLDADPTISIAAEGMRRAYLTGIDSTNAPHAPLACVRLVTAHWPRPDTPESAGDAEPTARALLKAIAGLIVPGVWLALDVRLPAPSQPLAIHASPLLAAAHRAGLGHLRAVHAEPGDEPMTGGPDYQCALVFRRSGRVGEPAPGAPTARCAEPCPWMTRS